MLKPAMPQVTTTAIAGKRVLNSREPTQTSVKLRGGIPVARSPACLHSRTPNVHWVKGMLTSRKCARDSSPATASDLGKRNDCNSIAAKARNPTPEVSNSAVFRVRSRIERVRPNVLAQAGPARKAGQTQRRNPALPPGNGWAFSKGSSFFVLSVTAKEET